MKKTRRYAGILARNNARMYARKVRKCGGEYVCKKSSKEVYMKEE